MENKDFVAARGLKLIRTAQILSIIAVITAAVGAIALLLGTAFAGGGVIDQDETLALGALGVAGAGSIIALVGLLAALASFIVQLVGLIKAGPSHNSYKLALYMVLGNIALGFISPFVMDNTVLSMIFKIASSVLVLLGVYFVLSATIALLREKGDEATATKGSTVRTMYLVCTVVSVLSTLLSTFLVLADLTAIALVITSAVQMVALFLYIGFLGRSVRSLGK